MLSFGKIKFTKLLKREKEDLVESPIIYDQGIYSNGFEKIYALENIDIKSVKKVSKEPVIEPRKEIVSVKKNKPTPRKESQLSFYQSCREERALESFKLDEPIQVLQLSLQAEKKLLQQGFKRLRELYSASKKGITSFNGMGQGHFDEIVFKLQEYLGEEDLSHAPSIDFLSILRCLLSCLDNKKIHILVAPYRLEDYFYLSPSEMVAVKYLPKEKRREVYARAKEEVKTSENEHYLRIALEKIALSFIKPWLYRRGGVMAQDEIIDYVIKRSKAPSRPILKLIQELFMKGEFLFKRELVMLDKDVYAVDRESALLYSEIILRARGFFYREALSFTLKEIVSWLVKGFVREWRDVPLTFIEKALKISPQFEVHKRGDGLLEIKVNVTKKDAANLSIQEFA